MKSIKILFIIIAIALAAGIIYLWKALPVISAYGAKNLCSCVYIAQREPDEVINGELNYSLIKYGTFEINRANNSATGSIFGLAKRTAVYRNNIGCTLLNETTKEELQKQPYKNIKPIEPLSDTVEWPLGEKITETQGLETNGLNRIVDAAFSDNRYVNPSGTRGLVVVYDEN